jgi:hypothetical protein
MFHAWSKKWSAYNADHTEERWDTLRRSPPSRIGYGTLHYMASQVWPGWEDDSGADVVISGFIHETRGERPEPDGTAFNPSDPLHFPTKVVQLRRQATRVSPTTTDNDPLMFHGDGSFQLPRWLVYDRIPESGVGLLSGQTGTYKSFQLIDLAVAVATGQNWLGRELCRPGGVLYIAAEGIGNLPLRFNAVIRDKLLPQVSAGTFNGDPNRLPLAWKRRIKPLRDKQSLTELTQLAAQAQEQFKREFDLDLVVIMLDTMSALAGWEDENDNAQAQQVMNTINHLSQVSKTFVLAADHYGKNASSGTRGASAREASADLVLASLGDRDEDTNVVTNKRLLIRKTRDGASSGHEFAFETREVDLGIVDDYGYPVTQLVIDWEAGAAPSQSNASQSAVVAAVRAVLTERPETCRLEDGSARRAVRATLVRRRFGTDWRARRAGAAEETVRKAFKRGKERAVRANEIGSFTPNDGRGVEWLWICNTSDTTRATPAASHNF